MRVFKNIFLFYINGFRNMPQWGRAIWALILLKLFIMFIVLKIFFFPNFLKSNFETDEERAVYVIEQITKRNSL